MKITRWLSGFWPWRKDQGDTVLPVVDREQEWLADLATLLCGIGEALVLAGERVSTIETTIQDISARYGVYATAIIVPTGLWVKAGQVIDFAPVQGDALRLDQVQRLYALVERLRKEDVPVADVRAELRTIRSLPARFTPLTFVAGYAVLTAGLGLIQHPSYPAVLGYLALGAFVGVLRLFGERFPVLATALPVVAAISVTVMASLWAGPLLHDSASRMLIPPLIAFLPGATLTMGTIELATGAMVSGVGRLAAGVNVLLLLAFGILVGNQLVTPRPAGQGATVDLGAWASWAGVLLLGVGFVICYSAPANILTWLLGVLLLERLAQVTGAWAAGAAFGAFLAGLLTPVLAAYIERRSAIPAQVTFLPLFWMLVPGSLGLAGISELVVQRSLASVGDLVTLVITVLAIAMGILVGASFQRRPRLVVSST